jgi:predicted CopG family antitoxin
MPSTINVSNKRCTILLRESVYRRLKSKGIFGESFSDLIERLLDDMERNAD